MLRLTPTAERPRVLAWGLQKRGLGHASIQLDEDEFRIVRSRSPWEATIRGADAPFDIIVARDVFFPKASADIKDIRKSGCSTPIIIITDDGRRRDCIAMLEAGADDFVLEDVDPEELRLRMRGLLRKKKAVSQRPWCMSL